MNLNDASDEDLVRHYRAGDAQAFDALVRRFQDRVFRLASVWLYDEQYAADATQEVFLRSHRGLRRFRFRAGVFTWLYRTTRNVCHEFNRRRSTSPVRENTVEEFAAAYTEPDSSAIRSETIGQLRTLVAELPPRQREVVILRVFEDLSVRQTAQAMGCREGTVKALLHRASNALRENLEREGEIDG
jgi:RNA polymerase sigma-70 factor (ECF subfamily)